MALVEDDAVQPVRRTKTIQHVSELRAHKDLRDDEKNLEIVQIRERDRSFPAGDVLSLISSYQILSQRNERHDDDDDLADLVRSRENEEQTLADAGGHDHQQETLL